MDNLPAKPLDNVAHARDNTRMNTTERIDPNRRTRWPTRTTSIIFTHPYRSGPIGHDGQPRCASCLATHDHPAHEAFANAGPFATEQRLTEARAIADARERARRWDGRTHCEINGCEHFATIEHVEAHIEQIVGTRS